MSFSVLAAIHTCSMNWPNDRRTNSKISTNTLATLRFAEYYCLGQRTSIHFFRVCSTCSEFNIEHVRSPPRMPRCNGLAERTVLDFKLNSLDMVVSSYNYTPYRELDNLARFIQAPYIVRHRFQYEPDCDESSIRSSSNIWLLQNLNAW